MKTRKITISIVLLCAVVVLSACTASEKEYYSQKENYVTATGTISYISYSEDMGSLYLGFTELSPTFDDNSFKIVGDNLLMVQEKGIDQKINIGDQIEFITAPRYFGDGYVMPIVAVSIDGEELLGIEDGIANLLKWLEQ